MRDYTKIYITKKAEYSARMGHPWVFEDEILRVEGEYKDGDLVDVLSEKAKYIGTGFINNHSKIRVRLISRNTNDKFDDGFFERRLRYALDYRLAVMGETDL